MALFRKRKRTASARALKNTKVIIFNEKVLLRLKKRYPRIAGKLFINLSQNLWDSIHLNINLYFDSIYKNKNYLTKKIEQVVSVAKLKREISYTDKLQLEDVLERLDSIGDKQKPIIDLMEQTEKGDIKIKKSLYSSMFQDFTKREENWCKTHLQTRVVSAKNNLFKQGEQADYYAILLEGNLVTRLDKNGQHSILETIHAGGIVGEETIFTDHPMRTSTVMATVDSKVAILNEDSVYQIANRKSRIAAKFSFNIVCLLSDRLEKLIAKIHKN
jgi:CRP-like cAMP-binding protein